MVGAGWWPGMEEGTAGTGDKQILSEEGQKIGTQYNTYQCLGLG